MGDTLGFGVGDLVGCSVGSSEGDRVGFGVGDLAGCFVGSSVSTVGIAVEGDSAGF